MSAKPKNTPHQKTSQTQPSAPNIGYERPLTPLSNYTLSSVCPACGNDTYKLACKVRCGRCGFMWDCSEL
jgi:hypothetical protein